MYKDSSAGEKIQSIRIAWHSDVSFEPSPPDFSSLRLTQLPEEGGGKTNPFIRSLYTIQSNNRIDTMWASGYEVYDRFSKPFQTFLESLTATFSQGKAMNDKAQSMGLSLEEGPRGSPSNVGTSFDAIHPVVRTHPVTGWKSVYAMGTHCRKINGLSQSESQMVMDKLHAMVLENHDLQVRFRWQNPGDIGIFLIPLPSLGLSSTSCLLL